MRLTFQLVIVVLLGIGSHELRGQELTQSTTSISPDKQWAYRCQPYGTYDQCAPVILKAGTEEEVVDLDQELGVHGPEAREAEVVWSPDSKRFACNYSPAHAHHTTYVVVAFYQLAGEKWVRLKPPADEASSRLQLAQLGRGRLPNDFKPGRCLKTRDVLKVRTWVDPKTAIVYAPCYGRSDGNVEAGFLFTLQFDEAGKWKVVETHRMSKKELKAAEQ